MQEETVGYEASTQAIVQVAMQEDVVEEDDVRGRR